MTQHDVPATRLSRIAARLRHARHWTVGRLLTVGYVLAIGGLLVVGFSSYGRIGSLLHDRDPVDHTYQVLGRVSQLRFEIEDAETGLLGYLLTDDETYLEPYDAAIGEVAQTMSALQALIADNPAQQRRLADLRPLLQERLADMSDLIMLRRTLGRPATNELMTVDDGMSDMRRVDVLLTAMRASEVALLEDRQHASGERANLTRSLIFWTTLGGAALAGIGAWWVSRRVTGPIARVTETARRVAAGDTDARAEVTGPAELVAMAAAVNASTQAMVEARDEAVAASMAKATFLATMSHEIRTPLNAVIGMTGLLMDTRLTAEQRELVTTVRDSGDALLEIINDILDYSKIEAGQLRLEDASFDVVECVDSALALVAIPAADKQLELVGYVAPSCPPVLRGDATRFRQILANLLSNAVKFTASGEIAVTVDAEPSGDGDSMLVRLAVRDTGIGIPAEHMDRVFRSFSQVDASTTRLYGGTGLGLAISRQLAWAMGGDITVDSTPGVGSTFTVTVVMSACVGDVVSTDSPTRLAGRSMLIVDDNETNRRVLRAQLANWGVRCIAVACAADALELVGAGASFDLAVLDMHMPDTDGIELAAALRELPAGRDLPLVLLSSVTTRPHDTTDRGFAAVLSKPARVGTLYSTLTRVLSAGAAQSDRSPVADGNAAAAAPPGRSLRVLLAEDNPVNQKVAGLVLGRIGHHVDVVDNGLEAVAAVLAERYDVVLMDLQMPELDGLGATRRIRTEVPAELQPHIVAMTASVLLEDREACYEAGMNDYLAKPVRADDLVAALAPLLPTAQAGTAAGATETADGRDAELENAVRDRITALAGPVLSPSERELVVELIGTFRERTPAAIEQLARAVQARDAAAAASVAHSLKGSAANIGATALATLAADLEAGARDGRLPDPVADLSSLRAEVDALAPVLDRLSAEIAAGRDAIAS